MTQNDRLNPTASGADAAFDRERLRASIARFRDLQPNYERFAVYLKDWFTGKAVDLGIYPIVMSRAKSLESFAEKICRPGKHYRDPLREMPDLCGVRVIAHTLDQVHTLAEVVAREFIVDQAQTEDTQARLDSHAFGYVSRHFLLQFKEPPVIAGLDEAGRRALADFKFELQLRTIAQHAWADVSHELGYKNEFRLPRRWQRELARLAALLEQCDQGFLAVKNAMGTYESSYSAYMSQQELRALADRLEMLHEIDPHNTGVMYRLLRACLALDDNATMLESVLSRFGERLAAYPPALRDVGMTRCQLNAPGSAAYRDGIEQMRRAVEADPSDVDALCSLGGALRRQGEVEQATLCYRRAYEIDPTNPYPLGNYIAEELVRKHDGDVVHFFRPAIAAAVERCRRQVEVEVNLPWAWFDLGIFSLYLGDPVASAAFYARGIADAPNSRMIRSAANTIERLLREGVSLPALTVVDKLLRLGWWIRASAKERSAAEWKPVRGPVSFASGLILVLSGGCGGLGAEHEPRLGELGRLLAEFRGTIVAGGTRSGIAGLAGELQARCDSNTLRTVGYVPAATMPGLDQGLDRRYTRHRHSSGLDFSVLEPLTFWEDYLASGADPAGLRLLGFNGGNIAGVEFRLALAFGARVGVVRGSGRAADELLADPLWKDHPGLEPLDLTPESIGRFVRPHES